MPQARQKYKRAQECPLHPEKVWQWLPGFENRFMVSSCGDIRMHQSFNRNGLYLLKHPRMLRQQPMHNGYVTVHIQTAQRRKLYYVHRIVLETFHGEAPPAMQAAHLDGTRTNNHLVNLQWVTRKDNMAHKRIHGTNVHGDRHPAMKIPEGEIPVIRAALEQGTTQTSLAQRYGVSWSIIHLIGQHKRRVIETH